MRSVELVRERLATARAAGDTFDGAWPAALVDVDDEWMAVLEATREAWAAAWCGSPATRAQHAAIVLLSDPDRQVLDDAAWDAAARICVKCDGPIPAGKQRNAIYCGGECRRAAYWDRRGAEPAAAA